MLSILSFRVLHLFVIAKTDTHNVKHMPFNDVEVSLKNNIVHVAVGVITQNDQVLICWRDASLHQGNRYEFPGGKIEAHESPEQALTRELYEELAIQVQHCIKAQQLFFNYPEKTVCLHIFKVTEFAGEPVGQQQQAVLWVHQNDLINYHFPDANAPILRMLKLPEQYVITQPLANQQSIQHIEQWLDWHIQHTAPCSWLYVREKTMSGQIYSQVINDLKAQRSDLHLVAEFRHIERLTSQYHQLSGVHLSQTDLMQQVQTINIAEDLLVFAACHDQAAIAKANQLTVDAVLISPLHLTLSHPEQAALGWQVWQQLAQQSHVPVFALGGVAPADLKQVQRAGGFGVAGIRAFLAH